MKALTLLGICLALIVSLAIPRPQSSHAQSSIPRFETSPCQFDLPDGQVEGETVDCGYLIVPENRADPASPTIKLAVAIFRSTDPNPGPPMIRLDGGPGGHSVGVVGELPSTPSLLERGDLILLDQRGVGLSEPSLRCPEEVQFTLDTLATPLSLDEEAGLISTALQTCYDRLAAEGINLSAYNSTENAADVRDLWQTLGYEAVNLYGVSYGTRLALTVMRDHPDGIRSVILDSAFPLQANLYVDTGASSERAFTLLFDACANDSACNEAFPNLKKRFFNTIDALNAEPVTIDITSFATGDTYEWLMTGDDFYHLMFNSLYATEIIGLIPAIIDLTEGGEYTLASLLAGVLILDFNIDFGMYLSVQCVEEVPFQTQTDIDAAHRLLAPGFRLLEERDPFNIIDACSIWQVNAAAASENEPVSSDIPTLVVAGQFDPITPPDYGRQTAAALNQSYFFEFPGAGHGVFDSSYCPLNITLAFLDDPTTPPDGSCISDMQLEYLIP